MAVQSLPTAVNWVPLDVLARLVLALGVGLLVGLEREWRGKEAGLRTFGLVSLLGALGGLLGMPYALACPGWSESYWSFSTSRGCGQKAAPS